MRLLLRFLLPLALLLGPVAAFGGVVASTAMTPTNCCEPEECPCPLPPQAPRAPQAPACATAASTVATPAAKARPRGPEPRPFSSALRPASVLRDQARVAMPVLDTDPPDPSERQSCLSTFRK